MSARQTHFGSRLGENASVCGGAVGLDGAASTITSLVPLLLGHAEPVSNSEDGCKQTMMRKNLIIICT